MPYTGISTERMKPILLSLLNQTKFNFNTEPLIFVVVDSVVG